MVSKGWLTTSPAQPAMEMITLILNSNENNAIKITIYPFIYIFYRYIALKKHLHYRSINHGRNVKNK